MKFKKLRKQFAAFALTLCTLTGLLPITPPPIPGNDNDAGISICVAPNEPTEEDFSPSPSTVED